MIKQIVINNEEYKNFELLDLTNNTIIMFPTPYLKNKVLRMISEIWEKPDDDNESVVYAMSLQDKDNPKVDNNSVNINYLPTTIVSFTNGQRFIFAVEPAFILKAKHPFDIWFVDVCGTDTEKVTCWALSDFKGHKEDWEQGIWNVYKNYCNGIYGCYKGY